MDKEKKPFLGSVKKQVVQAPSGFKLDLGTAVGAVNILKLIK